MIERIRRMLVKEFLQMLRDPRMRVVIFGMPIIQMVVIAFALNTDVSVVRMGVVDLDGTPSSRELSSEFSGSGYFRVVDRAASEGPIGEWLDGNVVRAVLHLPRGFEADLRGGRSAQVGLIVDGSDSNEASIVLGYANQIVRAYGARMQAERLALRLGEGRELAPLDLETRARFNPNLESRFYYVPGLIAVMLMLVGLLLTSIAIVREKEIGTIEQVMVTPIRKTEFILGKTLPYLAVGYVLLTLMLTVMYIVFGIPVRGSLLLLYALAGIYVAGNLGIALLVSVSAATQQQALLTAFTILMPGVLLSGFMFPIRNMPEPVQVVTLFNPMRWFLEILRGIVQKGAGLSTLWPAVLAQAALAALFLSLAVRRFRKTLA